MRSFPREVTKAIGLYHLPSTAGSAQAYPSTADVTLNGAVLPLDSKTLALEGVSFVEPWELYLDSAADVRLNDKVVIAGDSSNYYVSKIFTASFGTLSHKRVIVSKQV